MANRNGLNHKVRGFKGIGWNRALPAPFGFGNGYIGVGASNKYFSIPALSGQIWPLVGSIEYWTTVTNSAVAQRDIMLNFNDGSTMTLGAYSSTVPGIYYSGKMATGISPLGPYTVGVKYHVCYMWDATKVYSWGSALMPNTIASLALTSPVNLTVTAAALGAQVDGNNASTSKIDEFRIYNRLLSLEELILNNNNGIGNNPSRTDGLKAWYQFEKFETLDFSLLQDGSDMNLGIRDMSGQNNHLKQVNLDTNPASANYVLKPF